MHHCLKVDLIANLHLKFLIRLTEVIQLLIHQRQPE